MECPGAGISALNFAHLIKRVTARLRRRPKGARAPWVPATGFDWSIVGDRFGPENWTIGRVAPRIEVRATDEGVRLELEIAGVRPVDLHLGLEGRVLHICGERWPVDTPENEDTEERGLPYEARFGQFHRSVCLPYDVDEEPLSETVTGDLLAIVLKKKEARRP